MSDITRPCPYCGKETTVLDFGYCNGRDYCTNCGRLFDIQDMRKHDEIKWLPIKKIIYHPDWKQKVAPAKQECPDCMGILVNGKCTDDMCEQSHNGR